MFTVDWDEMPKTTSIPDSFIAGPMKDAPGTYVKIFIYLMMLTQKSEKECSVDTLAESFSIAASEVQDALKYWEKQKIIEIYYKSGNICGIKFNIKASEKNKNIHRLSPERVKSFINENSDAKNLLFVAEQYFGRPLTPIEMSTLLYFMDELGFSFDLCDYLLQYCVDKGHKSIRYIEKVAIEWHKNGFNTPHTAKENSAAWSKIHFDVLKAFGIRNRNPLLKEISYIDKWYKEYCFSIEIISEACYRTLSKTGQQSFEYADTILTSWNKQNVKSISDIEKLDEEFKLSKKSSSARSKVQTVSQNNKFHNFQQRNDDLDNLQNVLDRQLIKKDQRR